MPEKPAGIRIDPPPSVPRCRHPIPSAAATAAPPLDPPEVRCAFHGLRVIPVSGESQTAFQPNSGVVVLPRRTAPASRKRPTAGASSLQGWLASVLREPRNVGQPLVRMISLTE